MYGPYLPNRYWLDLLKCCKVRMQLQYSFENSLMSDKRQYLDGVAYKIVQSHKEGRVLAFFAVTWGAFSPLVFPRFEREDEGGMT